MEKIIFQNFWIFALLIGIINAVIFKFKSIKYIEEKPELKEGYNKIIRGFLFWGSIPFLIMGCGTLTGHTPNIFDYFRPRTLYPFVILFHLSIILIWLYGSYWIYFRDGAEFLSKHPGIVQKSNFLQDKYSICPKEIKFVWGLGLTFGIIAMIMMWVINIPVPKF